MDISFSLTFLEGASPQTTECLVFTNLTKEGEPSRDDFVPRPAFSNKHYPLALLARITFVM